MDKWLSEMDRIINNLKENLDHLSLKLGTLWDDKHKAGAEPLIRKAVPILGDAEKLYDFAQDLLKQIEAEKEISHA